MLSIDAPRSAWNITARKLTPKVSPSSVSVRARLPERTPEDDGASFGGACDAEDLHGGVRERLALEGRPQRPADRPVVMNVRSEL
jgi:hypothetical protein